MIFQLLKRDMPLKNKLTEVQIAFALKQEDTGNSIDQICPKKIISAAIHNWLHKVYTYDSLAKS